MQTELIRQDGARFPALWLRDNCPCGACQIPGSGQKLFDLADLAPDIVIAQAEDDADGVRIVFAPDGHRSHFTHTWLDTHRPGTAPPYDDRAEDAKALWTAADLDALPSGAWPSFADDPAERARCLDALLTQGFVVLHGVPVADRAVLDVARAFGYVRETNYGEMFEVRVEENPANLAFTSRQILPHTDNPYRDPVPTIQLLHCLANAAQGGDSGLVDGFHAAATLRREQPDAFDVLTRTPVTFRYADSGADLSTTAPLIGLDPLGWIRQIRFNNRSMRPITLEPDRIAAFYQAYRVFSELLYRPAARIGFRLEPGDCVIFDNTRILHARSAFTADGARHLQGCYADLDAAASELAVLRRALGIVAELEQLFTDQGAGEYLGEPVTQAEHMLQTAAHAEAAGAPDALVAAALLHDIGHFTGGISGHQLMNGTDNRHSHTGADRLAAWFPKDVTEPVRLHVAAKRYLCAVEPGYLQRLSPASLYTLNVQGGPMSDAEADRFAALPHAEQAVALRRWDEAAKDPRATVPAFAHYRPLLARLLRT
ncbi:gamma-butyrobetaine dioxygenase [Streptomyces sp. MUSC 14]|uniref:2-trimethylaminoethylphosphonate dioxygenase n=1 Tax=Streptomyces sp. MUSC 14 TaxID=1354889 RepID=UPI0008F5E084|nr:phosphonate degradation HD-domain oxygenase [Streptomyces sp. MUSC 14]OIJ90597.1 gamma-butyrobetaine dioxygenase [Streptomyces sp. MUSC 14]